MCRKFIVLVPVAAVTVFLLTGAANAADPNLIGWWKFDEGSGTTTADSSALGNDGTFGVDYNDLPDSNNAPQWVAGRRGEWALRFDRDDGEDFITCGNDPNFDVNGPMTVMAWVHAPVAEIKATIIAKGGDSWRFYWYRYYRADWNYDFVPEDDSLSIRVDDMDGEIGDYEWHHQAVTVGRNEDGKWEAKMFWDGNELTPEYGYCNPVDNNDNCCFAIDTNDLWIGGQDTNDKKGERYWSGYLDDIRIYDYNLTQAELKAIYRQPYDLAHNLSPADGAEVSPPLDGKITLSWVASPNAVDHNLYFGTSSPPPFVKNQPTTTYEPNTVFEDGGVDFGGTYYWQIEEDDANSTNIYKTPIASFSVTDYIVIDDFAGYYSESLFREVWAQNGKGFLELDQATGCETDQSMYFIYYNYAGYTEYIEGDNTLDSATDLTSEDGLKALSLYFKGVDSDNGPDDLYVRLQSSDGNTATVYHPNNPNAILETFYWQEWNIDLQDFKQGDSNDVNLTEVTHIVIGIGDPCGTAAEVDGEVLVDDIRLYPPRCIFEEGPLGDMAGNAGDCKVDNKDLGLMSDDWLSTNPGLILWYKFDDSNDSNIVDDSSGYGYHGTIDDTNCFNQYPESHDDRIPVQGVIDGCVNFGQKDHIDVPTEALSRIRDEITVAFWAFGDTGDPEPGKEADKRVKDQMDCVIHAKHAESTTARVLEILLPETEVNNTDADHYEYDFRAGNPNDGYDTTATSSEQRLLSEYRGNWNHFAFTKNTNTGVMTIYVNGEPNETDPGEFDKIYGAQTWEEDQKSAVRIGMKLDEVKNTHYFMWGSLDDFRIYDYALSASDIARLANQQEPLSPERGNFDNDPNGIVNFEDYAELGNNWLKEQLWP